MITFRQIEANRRNARLSTGPVTEEGRSQQNAVRHGLTTEAAIDALEDAAVAPGASDPVYAAVPAVATRMRIACRHRDWQWGSGPRLAPPADLKAIGI